VPWLMPHPNVPESFFNIAQQQQETHEQSDITRAKDPLLQVPAKYRLERVGIDRKSVDASRRGGLILVARVLAHEAILLPRIAVMVRRAHHDT